MPYTITHQLVNNIDEVSVSRKKLREGDVDYHEMTGMLGRLLGR
jgi:hypothetical protein